MKKLFLIFAIGLTLTSCTNFVSEGKVSSGELEFTIMKVNGCQYIFTNWGEGALFTHMGNCNNPSHNCPCKNDTLR